MTTELVSRAAYGLAKARHRMAAARRRGTPTVVFSMAKTGSSAVVRGLRAAAVPDVHQVHDLDRDFLVREEAEYRWTGRPWRNWDAQRLLSRPPTERTPWRVVSLVRDPIAQTASAFFQPGARRGYLHLEVTVDELLERFGHRLDHLPLRWFESHVEPALGIDVYASEFDPGVGSQVLATPSVRLLLLRAEGLDVARAALAELVGAERPVEVPRANVGADKDYASLYTAFLAALRPSPEQLERIYNARVVRHFYSADEIHRFQERWSTGVGDDLDR